MIRAFKTWLASYRFKQATKALDRDIERVRAKHGRVSEAQAAKTRALHRALAQAVRS